MFGLTLFLNSCFDENKSNHSVSNSNPKQQSSQIRYIILLVDYIAGDYKEAIEKPGVIKSSDEYAEMLEFSKLIEEMYPKEKQASQDIKKQITLLSTAIKEKHSNEKVKNLALKLRKDLVKVHKLTVTLKKTPNLKKGQEVF